VQRRRAAPKKVLLPLNFRHNSDLRATDLISAIVREIAVSVEAIDAIVEAVSIHSSTITLLSLLRLS
jgi:hypothetical protein